MSVETSAVQIVVNVTDNTSSQVLSGVEQNLNRLGGAGLRSGAQVQAGMRQAGAGMLTAREQTRLAAEEMGVRLPRAMISLIGQSKVAQAALTSLSTAMIGFASIQIGAMVFTQLIGSAKKLWDTHLSLIKAAEDYNAEIAKSAHDDFGNTRSIETTRLRIDEATEAIKRFQSESRKEAGSNALTWRSALTANANMIVPGAGTLWDQYQHRSTAHDLLGQSIDAQRQLDELKNKKAPEQQHQANIDAIELAHAGDSRLRGEQKITAEKEKQHQLDSEGIRFDANREGLYANYITDSNRKFTQGSKEKIAREKQDANLANLVAPNAGESTYGTKNQIADAKADAELFNLRREQGHELERMREQALEAGLRGDALYKAQEAAAIDELKFKDMDSATARNAVHAKFHAEEMKRLQDEERAVAKMREQTQLAGLTGTARITQEGRNRISDVYASTTLNPGQRLAEINEINKQTAQQIGALNKSFSERVDDIVGRSATRELQGFARIRADAQNEIRDLRKEAGEKGGTPSDLARGEAGISAGAAGQAADLTRKNAQETAQIEEQARVKFFSAEKQKTAAINAELQERKQKYLEELNSQQISQEDYNRRVIAAQQNANAEMIEAATEARKKMAGEFDQLFEGMNHPLKYLEKLGDKAAGNAAASLVQHFQGGKGGAGDAHAGGAGGIFGDVLGGMGFGGFGKKGKTPGAGADIKAPGGHGVGQGTFSVASATIHIGSATISGAGAAGPGGGGGGVGPGGGTTMLAPGTTGATGGFGAGGPSTSAGATAWGSGGSTVGGAGSSSGVGAAMGIAQGAAGLASKGKGFWGGLGGDISEGFPIAKGMKDAFHKKGTDQQPQSDYLLKQLFHHQAEAGASGNIGGAGTGGSRAADGRNQKTQMPDSNRAPGSAAQGYLSSTGSLVQTVGKAMGTSDNSSGSAGSGNASKSDKTMAAAGEGITAAQDVVGLYSAHEGGGGVGGGLKGAASGAQLGLMVGGPVGMVIGAAAGAIIGGIGSSHAGRDYDLKTVRPRIASDLSAYHSGGMNYLDSYSDAQSLQMEAAKTTTKMGPADGRYYQNTIKPEILQFMGKLTAEQKAGRSMYTASAASYDIGSDSIPSTGWNLNHQGERIIPSDQNERITQAMESSSRMPVQSASMGDVHLHVHAIDAKGVAGFLDKYKHNIRSAINDSYAENSGGGMN